LANIFISLEGIDQAIASLNYKGGSIKFKAVTALRSFYTSEESIKTLNSIDMDALIRSIWEVEDDPAQIKAKRRNFSSIKSSINADLENLSKKNPNLENIIITESNIFDLTEAAKSNLLNSFSDAVKTGGIDLDQATHLLKAVSEFLEHMQMDNKDAGSEDIISQIKKILNKITKDVLSEEDPEITPGLKKLKQGDFGFDEGEDLTEEVEEIELDEDQEIEEIDEDIDTLELDEDSGVRLGNCMEKYEKSLFFT